MSKDYIEYLRHILIECEYITSVITTDYSKEHFLTDETHKRAIVRSLEIIGEATKQIPVDVKLRWNGIAWKNMAGMRDRLIHDYIGVNYHIVWDVARNIIPVIKDQIEKIVLEIT
ncbi:DUF86 domain-containing protein [Dyadobacter sp. CY323]|uniref:HepT-like ribonuclease domain-containing protein n=1 Tax=Dyadobacter sp. CY323 TaxID=2907302 RepID=UPI001F28CC75|nr:HepT-like ribonuclease domain-containing protein [Dyadobacter sp. CY323]MCE6991326.1 DUF86 domain-containing protein [Dyadobacter sp. CY323]